MALKYQQHQESLSAQLQGKQWCDWVLSERHSLLRLNICTFIIALPNASNNTHLIKVSPIWLTVAQLGFQPTQTANQTIR